MKIQVDKRNFKNGSRDFGIRYFPNRNKNKPVKNKINFRISAPQTIKELRSVLGLSGYYRQFIKDYTKLAKPLSILLRGVERRMSKNLSSKIKITLNQDVINAFNKLKNSLISFDVMLQYPDFGKEFHLTTDASDYAMGAVHEQDNKPITFVSRTLTKTE